MTVGSCYGPKKAEAGLGQAGRLLLGCCCHCPESACQRVEILEIFGKQAHRIISESVPHLKQSIKPIDLYH